MAANDPAELLDSWINGNRNHVREVLRRSRSKLQTFARMLAMARDDIREDLIKAFAREL
jgi:hypothetical protein